MGAGIEYCINPVNDPNNPAYCFQGIDNGWRQINFSELYHPPPASDLLTRYQSCFPGHSISTDFASMMFVKPQLAFPPDVTDIDPVWATWGGSTCTPVNLGVYDPPRLLQKATALAPVPTPAADSQAQKAPPSPAATLKSPVAAPTKAVPGVDPNNGVKANDPGINNAETATPTTAQPEPRTTVVDPVDPSVVAQNESPPANGNSNAVKMGSNSDSNSDPSSGNTHSNPVASEEDTPPVDAEKQSGMNAATNPGDESGTDPGTVNNDPSTAPITLLPQQPADTAKEKSSTSDENGVTTDGTTVGNNKGTAGGVNGGTDNDPNGGTSNDSSEGVNGASESSNGGKTGGTNGDPGGGTEGDTTESSQDTSGGTDGANDGMSGRPNSDGNANPPPVASINSQPITKDIAGNILLSGSTLAPGSTAIFSDHTIANVPSAIIIDGATYAPNPSPPPFLLNNQLLQLTNGVLTLGSHPLTPGSSTTISNHIINYANPTQIIQDGTTHLLVPISPSSPLVLNGHTFSRATNGALLTAGTTILPGPAATIAGHVYALLTASDSATLVMDGATYALPALTSAYQIQLPPSSSSSTTSPRPLTLANGLVLTPSPQTVLPPNGASIVPGGTTYSPLPSAAGILAAGITLPLPLPHPVHTTPSAPSTPAGPPFVSEGTRASLGSEKVQLASRSVGVGVGSAGGGGGTGSDVVFRGCAGRVGLGVGGWIAVGGGVVGVGLL